MKKIFKTGAFILFLIGMLWASAFSHEQVHQIAYEYDGIPSKIVYEFGFPAKVVAQSQCESDKCFLINGINEAIEYNITPFLVLISIGFIFIIYILDNKDEK